MTAALEERFYINYKNQSIKLLCSDRRIFTGFYAHYIHSHPITALHALHKNHTKAISCPCCGCRGTMIVNIF